MTALPSNLAAVGDDLARATLKDAKRSTRRRRIVTVAVACALLALTASAAIATGWLSEKTPTSQAVPSLAAGAADATQVLLTGLGPRQRELTSQATATGAVCITLSGFEAQCVPALLVKQQVSWFTRTLGDGTTLIFGIARDDVTALEAVLSDGRAVSAQLGNGAFFLELTEGPPTHLLVHLSDGTSTTKAISPCPPSTPDCTP